MWPPSSKPLTRAVASQQNRREGAGQLLTRVQYFSFTAPNRRGLQGRNAEFIHDVKVRLSSRLHVFTSQTTWEHRGLAEWRALGTTELLKQFYPGPRRPIKHTLPDEVDEEMHRLGRLRVTRTHPVNAPGGRLPCTRETGFGEAIPRPRAKGENEPICTPSASHDGSESEV